MNHEPSKSVGSWPNGVGGGLFLLTLTCSCGESFEVRENNDYYSTENSDGLRSQWRLHAATSRVAALTAELERLPSDVPLIRTLAETELQSWSRI